MPRLHESLDLFTPEAVEVRRALPRPVPSKPQLWIAVCLPGLAFECLAVAHLSTPSVVVEADQGQLHVIAASEAATNAGVAPGGKLSTALALAASLQVFDRAPSRERASLESLAGWAKKLTSMVSIEAPESVLLEVAGSLRLFGSLETIKAMLHEELSRRYRDFRLCAAPTAMAALWLARAASTDVVQWRELAGRLATLPVAATRWPTVVQELLRDLGLRTVGDCVRLPRDGFARRVGRSYLLDLDRAFGRSIDLRAEFEAPESWSARVELDETVDRALFLEAIEQLLDGLAAELRRRQAQIGRLDIAFEHLHRPPTVERFDLREPAHERERLLPLIEDRLERSVLPFPVVALRISSGPFQPLELESAGLFEVKPLEERVQVLLERLQERFGRAAVYGLRAVAEHRPEKAWTKWLGSNDRQARDAAQWPKREARPLWLLPAPVAIEARRGSLELCSGPERIESGWWDEQDIARDYYMAKNGDGQKLWVFRDHRTRCWFLHGLFG
jgi:protein ImuB